MGCLRGGIGKDSGGDENLQIGQGTFRNPGFHHVLPAQNQQGLDLSSGDITNPRAELSSALGNPQKFCPAGVGVPVRIPEKFIGLTGPIHGIDLGHSQLFQHPLEHKKLLVGHSGRGHHGNLLRFDFFQPLGGPV